MSNYLLNPRKQDDKNRGLEDHSALLTVVLGIFRRNARTPEC